MDDGVSRFGLLPYGLPNEIQVNGIEMYYLNSVPDRWNIAVSRDRYSQKVLSTKQSRQR